MYRENRIVISIESRIIDRRYSSGYVRYTSRFSLYLARKQESNSNKPFYTETARGNRTLNFNDYPSRYTSAQVFSAVRFKRQKILSFSVRSCQREFQVKHARSLSQTRCTEIARENLRRKHGPSSLLMVLIFRGGRSGRAKKKGPRAWDTAACKLTATATRRLASPRNARITS